MAALGPRPTPVFALAAGRQQLRRPLLLALVAGVLALTYWAAHAKLLCATAGSAWPTRGDTVHVFLTSNGSPQLNYQTLALVGSFKLARRMKGGSKMAAFTRILHRSAPDALSAVVPTYRVRPLHPACDHGPSANCTYLPGERAHALRQFLDAAKRQPALIKAPWLYLVEPDSVFVRPVLAPRAESGARAAAFRYRYLTPTNTKWQSIMQRFYPSGLGPLTDIPATGPAPVLARADEWARLAQRFEGFVAQVEADKHARLAFGHAREMYAFSVAAAVERVTLDARPYLDSALMIQAPVHDRLADAAQIHYAWAFELTWSNGNVMYRFDKRDLELTQEGQIPKVPLPPPWDSGMRLVSASGGLADGLLLSPQHYETILLLLQTINRGIDAVGGANWRGVLAREGLR